MKNRTALDKLAEDRVHGKYKPIEDEYSANEIADFLEGEGFDVIITEDGSEGRTEWVHQVHFEGNGLDYGCRAAELAIAQGYTVFSVQKVWDYYRSDRPDEPYWQMTLGVRK